MKQRIVKFISILLVVIAVACALYVGIKSMVVRVWLPSNIPETYFLRGVDGREMTFVILPENKVLIAYGNPQKKQVEHVLTKMRGTFAHHYIGPIWRLDRGGIFGLRLYKKSIEPIEMEIEILNKFHMGLGESSFSKIGSKHYQVILREKDRIKYSGMWLNKVESDNEFINIALQILNENKSP